MKEKLSSLKNMSMNADALKSSDILKRMVSQSVGSQKSKKGKFVLFLGDEGAILVLMREGQVVRRLYAPSAEEEHIEPLLQLMREHPAYPLSLLVDMIDQSYVRHTLPPVSPLGVNKLVQRRLERDFVPEDIKGSISLGREKTGRKEWNFMLIALAHSAMLQQWMDLLLELPNHFSGIYLVPVEGKSFIDELSKKLSAGSDEELKWQLLVTHDKVSGFRQIVLKDGRLIFTRLTQASLESTPAVQAGNIEQEILNTIEYLRRLSYDEQTGLEITIIVAEDIKQEIDADKLKANRVHIVTPFEVSRLLNLGQAALSSDRFGDVVLATFFGLHDRPRLKLMSSYAKKLDWLYKARLGAKAAASVLIAYFLFEAATHLLAIQSSYSTKADLERQTVGAEQNLVKVNQALDGLGEDQNVLINAVTLFRASQAGEYDPLRFVRNFVPVLEPGILVRQMNWETENLSFAGAARRGSTAQTKGNEKEFYPYTVKIDVEFNNHNGKRDQLLKNTRSFLTKIRTNFNRYTIDNEKLKGTTSEKERLVLNFDDPVQQGRQIEEGENMLTITMTGPLPEDVIDRPGEGAAR